MQTQINEQYNYFTTPMTYIPVYYPPQPHNFTLFNIYGT